MISFHVPTAREVINLTGGMIGMTLIVLLGFTTYALIYVKVPVENQNALTLLIGILSANVGTVVGFYFGSSSTAKKQAETIDTLAKTAQTAGVALGTSPEALVIPPGESATATATDAGTVIQKEGEQT